MSWEPTAATPEWLQMEWLAAGQLLLEQGGKTGKLFVLRSGVLEVERDGMLVGTARQPGAVFGEMSLLLDIVHSATVRAVTDVEVFVLADALRVLEAHPAWTLQIARLLARRVDATTAQLAAQGAEERERLVLPQNVLAQWADPQV